MKSGSYIRQPAQWLDWEVRKQFPKLNLPPKKVPSYLWSAAGLIHYSFLNPSETITSEKYAQKIYLLFSRSVIWLFETPWTAARQVSLSFTISQSLLKLMSIESVMPSKHLILCHPFSSCLQSFPPLGSFCWPMPAACVAVFGATHLFPGRTDAEAPILWPPDAKSWLTGKDSDAGKDWCKRGRG